MGMIPGGCLPAVNQRWVEVQSLTEIENRLMQWLGLNRRPQLKLIATALAAEATVATHGQVSDEVAWRIATAEGAAAAYAASKMLYGAEADQFQDLLHRDASA